MKIIIITGGLACGKSTVLKFLRESRTDLGFFDCDQEVRILLDSGVLSSSLRSKFGSSAVFPDGKANRAWLREQIFSDKISRIWLENLIHPLIRKECLARRSLAEQDPLLAGFIIDIPLFFESDFDYQKDTILVVAASSDTQRKRLVQRDQFPESLAEAMLQAQLPILEKMRRADVVFWNEGSISALKQQLDLFLSHYLP